MTWGSRYGFDDDDDLERIDAVCEPGYLRAVVPDDQAAGLVLFADVDFTDRAAVVARAAEWRALFPT